MKRLLRHRFQPQLEALEDRWCPSTTRPITDFLMAQGTTSTAIFNFGVTGLPDEIAWTTANTTPSAGNGRLGGIDYTGQDAAFLGLNLGTTTKGTVSERPLPGGQAEVTVNLTTHNAFAWATQWLGGFPPTRGNVLFGYTPDQLQANSSLTPPLANSVLHAVFDIPRPGAPLPDLFNDFVLGNAPQDYKLVSLDFRATATGTTPTGQQATLVVSQTGVLGLTPDFHDPIRDGGFTAEVVDINIHGSASAATTSSAAGPITPAAAAPLPSVAASQASAVDAVFATYLDDAQLPGGSVHKRVPTADAVFATSVDDPLA